MTIPQAFALAVQHHEAGRLEDAEALYRQILAAQPNHPDALHHLGIIARQVGHYELAVELIGRAIAVHPHNPATYSNLSETYRVLRRFDAAIAVSRRAIELKPDYPEAHHNLGSALAGCGRFDEAIAAFREAVTLRPGYAQAHGNLGNALRERGQLDEAIAAYHQALALRPDYAEVHSDLGIALAQQGRLDMAAAACRRAIEIQPGSPDAWLNLGHVLKDQGQLDEAVAACRKVLALKPDFAAAQSNLILTALYHPAFNQHALQRECERWEEQFARPLRRFFAPHDNTPDLSRRLKIGYISADFRDHVVGRNLVLPLFRGHDGGQFEIFCYSGVMKPDHWTEEFRRHSDHWRDTAGLPEETLADMIRRDRVDILVDLSLHTANNRLLVFARQPAPVQVSFGGYPGSTGLGTIGYRISDRYLEGNGERMKDEGRRMNLCPSSPSLQSSGTEQVFLLDSFWCYDPCGPDVTINPLPASESGKVTFGSLNNLCKINDPLLRLWARVLAQVKDSRLVLLRPADSHQTRILDVLRGEGIEADRVEFVAQRSRPAYLELYGLLDIILDPFPFNGHTTSLDALWMGVPVVSLAGQHPVSRAGYSQLSNLGLPELAAFSEDDYVGIAAQLAHDLPRLAELRKTLRRRMEASPLMDTARFVRNIETAYRTIWEQWCDKKQS